LSHCTCMSTMHSIDSQGFTTMLKNARWVLCATISKKTGLWVLCAHDSHAVGLVCVCIHAVASMLLSFILKTAPDFFFKTRTKRLGLGHRVMVESHPKDGFTHSLRDPNKEVRVRAWSHGETAWWHCAVFSKTNDRMQFVLQNWLFAPMLMHWCSADAFVLSLNFLLLVCVMVIVQSRSQMLEWHAKETQHAQFESMCRKANPILHLEEGMPTSKWRLWCVGRQEKVHHCTAVKRGQAENSQCKMQRLLDKALLWEMAAAAFLTIEQAACSTEDGSATFVCLISVACHSWRCFS